MAVPSSVIAHASVEAFFYEVLQDSLERQGLVATEHTEHYLVGLLGNYAKARITDEALALKLAHTVGDDGERVKALKEVGDTSLYLTGFFADSLERQLVQADYYVSLGAAAYRELAGRMAGSSAQEVYDQLSSEFPRFVDVLTDVRSQVSFGTADVASLYDEWLRTRSEWVEERLRSLGVLVPGPGEDLPQ